MIAIAIICINVLMYVIHYPCTMNYVKRKEKDNNVTKISFEVKINTRIRETGTDLS